MADMFYDNSVEHFYKAPYVEPYEPVEIQPEEFGAYYEKGYSPLNVIDGMGIQPTVYQWAPTRCVDCRTSGGSKKKPEGWPNDHR